MSSEAGQQHPLSLYFWIWGLLFVVSTFSYFTDYMEPGELRWALILIFMLVKAGYIVAINPINTSSAKGGSSSV